MTKTGSFDLDAFLPYRLTKAAEWASRGFAALYREKYNMTRPQWRTLANLGRHEKLTATEICKLSSQHKTMVSRAVAALERRRWLKRVLNERDRREEWLELTGEGRRAFKELARLAEWYDEELRRQLGRAAIAQLDKGLCSVEAQYARGPESNGH